ncbi:hypothetical protein FHX41_2716 [Actinomadura hallensis]|uniref:Uncharacterized protein n=1 Tax=Actinomadura hallensis TaxID=337895 RepID=A0A543IEN5_9ACTN|nr:hypothetical protein [Actinomadura hallensis]TQM69035.1 hypothetical protein FHX41_2716 [Actinomadura hallensis]
MSPLPASVRPGAGAARDAPGRARAGRLRVEWSPGSDLLTGICHCGAHRTAEDPAEIWAWLLAHPAHPGA